MNVNEMNVIVKNEHESDSFIILGLYVEGLRVFYHAVNEIAANTNNPDMIGAYLDALSKFSTEAFGKVLTEVIVSDLKINLFKFKVRDLDAILYSVGKHVEEDSKREKIITAFGKLAEFVEGTSEMLATCGGNEFLREQFRLTAEEICNA